jgi:biotin transporter BioY
MAGGDPFVRPSGGYIVVFVVFSALKWFTMRP